MYSHSSRFVDFVHRQEFQGLGLEASRRARICRFGSLGNMRNESQCVEKPISAMRTVQGFGFRVWGFYSLSTLEPYSHAWRSLLLCATDDSITLA